MKRSLASEKGRFAAGDLPALLNFFLSALGPWKWLTTAVAIALAALAFAWSRPADTSIWSATASIQMGKIVPVEAIASLLTNNAMTRAIELVETPDNVIWRTNTNQFRHAVFANSGLDQHNNPADWNLFVSTFRTIQVTQDGLLQVELSATSPEATNALMRSVLTNILSYEAKIEKQRTALLDQLVASYTRQMARVDNVTAAKPSDAVRPPTGLPQSDDAIHPSRSGQAAADLFATREGLLMVRSTQIPTSVVDAPKIIKSGRSIGRYFLAMLAGLGTLAAVIFVTALVLATGRDLRPRETADR